MNLLFNILYHKNFISRSYLDKLSFIFQADENENVQCKVTSATFWKGKIFLGFLFPIWFNFKSYAQFHFQNTLRENVIQTWAVFAG